MNADLRSDRPEAASRSSGPRSPAAGLLVGLALVAGAVGCTSPDVTRQRLVSKPGMQFSDSSVFRYYCGLLTQIEPGSALTGGAQAAGCTSCR